MEAINPLHHLNLSPQRNCTTKSSQLNVTESIENSYRLSLVPSSSDSSSNISSYSKFNPVSSVKARHAQIIKMPKERDSDTKVQSLITSYLEFRDFQSAAMVFLVGFEQNYLYWNSFLEDFRDSGGDPYEILEVFVELHDMGVTFGSETLAIVLKLSDLVTYNSMVSGYSMAGRIDEALDMIKRIKNSGLTPNVVSWTALISGSCQNGYHKNAFDYCYQMQAEGVKPNSATIASLLRVCAGLSLLQKGKEAHCLSIRNSYTEDAFVCTALIDMYSKAGDLESAYNVFHKAENKTLASWNSMIMGFSTYGHGKEAISLFRRLREEKLKPDAITMTALLAGCKHFGLVDEGWRFFDSMETKYGITPTIQHYSCMVDLLGRAGYLDEAWDFIRQMPIEPDSTIWGAFLGSCRIHGNIQLGEIAAKKNFKLEQRNPANYVLLMNMYAAAERWDDVENVKDLMDRRSLKIGNVWSWIEINKTVHVFSASGKPHPEDGEVYFELYHLLSEIKSMGYVPDTKCVHQNIDEVEKEKTLLSHTEKRAITYGLINTKANTPIRVIKNTTICADCHTFARYTSLTRKRQIILKDGIRFHHFTEGKCSCRDFL